VIIWL